MFNEKNSEIYESLTIKISEIFPILYFGCIQFRFRFRWRLWRRFNDNLGSSLK